MSDPSRPHSIVPSVHELARPRRLEEDLADLERRTQGGAVTLDEVARCRFHLRREGLEVSERERLAKLLDELTARFEFQHHGLVGAAFGGYRPFAVALTSRGLDGERVHPAGDIGGVDEKTATDDDPSRLHVYWGIGDDDWIARSIVVRCQDLHDRAVRFLPQKDAEVCVMRLYSIVTVVMAAMDQRQSRGDTGRDLSADPAAIAALESEFDRAVRLYDQAAQGTAAAKYAAGMIVGLLVVFAAGIVGVTLSESDPLAERLWVSAAAGGIGGLVSVLQRMTSGHLSVGTEQSTRALVCFGALRPVVGALFGLAVCAAFSSDPLRAGNAHGPIPSYAALGFLGGFFERFAQDVVQRVAEATGWRKHGGAGTAEAVSKLVTRIPDAVQSSIATALQGPELVRWRGYVSAQVRAPEGSVPMDRDDVATVATQRQYELVVRFSSDNTGAPGERLLDVQGGESAEVVPFLVIVASDLPELARSQHEVVVPAQSADRVVVVPFRTPQRPGRHRFWVQLRQGTRTLQMLPVEI